MMILAIYVLGMVVSGILVSAIDRYCERIGYDKLPWPEHESLVLAYFWPLFTLIGLAMLAAKVSNITLRRLGELIGNKLANKKLEKTSETARIKGDGSYRLPYRCGGCDRVLLPAEDNSNAPKTGN